MSVWPRYYILVDRTPFAVDLITWAQWWETHRAECKIGGDVIGKATISTVFLGLDHNFFGRGDPVLFETMIFGGGLDQEQRRYATYTEAERGHAEAVTAVRIAQARIKSIADKAGVE
jgi:hypothetical protein